MEAWAGVDIFNRGGKIEGRSRPKTSKEEDLSTPCPREKTKKKSQGCNDLIKKPLRIPCAYYKVALLVGMQIGAILLENSSAVSYKAKHTPTYTNSPTPANLPYRNESICS